MPKTPAQIRRVIVIVTKKCNLGCPDCLARNGRDAGWSMPWTEMEEFIERTVSLDRHYGAIALTGGEPTLWPFLKRAVCEIRRAGICNRIEVCTNAIKKGLTIADFAGADLIRITDYGALNRYNIWHLKRAGGRRVRVRAIVHVPYPSPGGADTTPGRVSCYCRALTIYKRQVYACPMQARAEQGGIPMTGDFGAALLAGPDPRDHPLCKTCYANESLKNRHVLPVTVNLELWDTGFVKMLQTSWRGTWLRNMFRRVKWRQRRS